MVVVFLHASLRAENIQRRGAVGAAIDTDAVVFGAVCLNDERAFLPRRKRITARDSGKKFLKQTPRQFFGGGRRRLHFGFGGVVVQVVKRRQRFRQVLRRRYRIAGARLPGDLFGFYRSRAVIANISFSRRRRRITN